MTEKNWNNCPTMETIAAFVDRTLPEAEQKQVEEHIASCQECWSIFSETARFVEDEGMSEESSVVPIQRWTWTRAASVAAVVFLAAAATIFYLRLDRRVDSPIARLSGVMQTRPVETRIAGLDYKPMAPRMRSGEVKDAPWKLLAEAAAIREGAEADPTPENLYALGVAQFALGEWENAAETLKRAAEARPDDAVARSDLAAALYARAIEERRPDLLPAAFDEAAKAVELDPDLAAAHFNRAMILEAMHLDEEAEESWNRVIELEPKSGWAEEAQERMAKP